MSDLHEDLRGRCADMGRLIRNLPKGDVHMAGTHLKIARRAAEAGDSSTVFRKLSDVSDLIQDAHGTGSKHSNEAANIAAAGTAA
jgi:hypothetical protein